MRTSLFFRFVPEMVISVCDVDLATIMFLYAIGYDIQAQTVVYRVPQLKLFSHFGVCGGGTVIVQSIAQIVLISLLQQKDDSRIMSLQLNVRYKIFNHTQAAKNHNARSAVNMKHDGTTSNSFS